MFFRFKYFSDSSVFQIQVSTDIKTKILFPTTQAILAFVCAVFILEHAFALAGIGEQEFLEINEDIGFAPMPDKRVTWRKEGFGVHLYNKDGLPDWQGNKAKASNTYRVALLGDSLAQGLEVQPEENFARVTERALNDQAIESGKAKRFEFINFGVSNYSLGQSYLQLKDKVLAYQPDLVIVCSRPDSFARLKTQEVTGLSTASVFFALAEASKGAVAGNLKESRASLDQWLETNEAKRIRSTKHLRRVSRIWGAIAQALESSSAADARHWDAQYLLDAPRSLTSKQMLKNWRDRGAVKDKNTEQIAPLAGALFLTMAKICREHKCAFAILRLSAEDGYSNPDENNYLSSFSAQHNIKYIDCTDIFRRHLEENPENKLFYFVHMNKNGHALVAKQLAKELSGASF